MKNSNDLFAALPHSRRSTCSVSFALISLLCLAWVAQPADAAITLGVLDDFEDGGLGGWAPPKANTTNVPGGPTGSTRALEITSGGRLAAFDAGSDISGLIDPAVNAIEVDMFRNIGASALEMRLVLFGPGTGNRWTSTALQILPGNGLWDTYSFSILESNLTHVAGGGTYADLVGNLNRIMFRHDLGGPSAEGTPVGLNADPFFIDNVTAVPIPEPTSLALLGLGGMVLTFRRRRGG